jgi:hypothetical protein
VGGLCPDVKAAQQVSVPGQQKGRGGRVEVTPDESSTREMPEEMCFKQGQTCANSTSHRILDAPTHPYGRPPVKWWGQMSHGGTP